MKPSSGKGTRGTRGAKATKGKGARGDGATRWKAARMRGNDDNTVSLDNDHEPVAFTVFAEGIGVMDCLIEDHIVESCDGSDLACWIHNVGTVEDKADLLLAVLPIAQRVCKRKWGDDDWRVTGNKTTGRDRA